MNPDLSHLNQWLLKRKRTLNLNDESRAKSKEKSFHLFFKGTKKGIKNWNSWNVFRDSDTRYEITFVDVSWESFRNVYRKQFSRRWFILLFESTHRHLWLKRFSYGSSREKLFANMENRNQEEQITQHLLKFRFIFVSREIKDTFPCWT